MSENLEQPNFIYQDVPLPVKSHKKRKRDKSRVEAVNDDTTPHTEARKRKRSVPSKLKPTASSEYIPLKRPRGRPPLNVSGNTTSSTGMAAPVRVPNRSHARKPDLAASAAILPPYHYVPIKSSKFAIDTMENEGAKTQRPHSALMTQRIISRLMTEGPLSIADLVGYGNEAPPRDLVQSIIDVLQVTAVVIQLKVKDFKAQPSSSTSSSSSTLNNSSSSSTLYAMAGIAKGSESTELHKLPDVTKVKLASAVAARKRIAKLQVYLVRAVPFFSRFRNRLLNLKIKWYYFFTYLLYLSIGNSYAW
jgi:hypothetical protein